MVLTIVFMYVFAFALAPLIAFALWVAFAGDRMRAEEEARLLASSADATEASDASESQNARSAEVLTIQAPPAGESLGVRSA